MLDFVASDVTVPETIEIEKPKVKIEEVSVEQELPVGESLKPDARAKLPVEEKTPVVVSQAPSVVEEIPTKSKPMDTTPIADHFQSKKGVLGERSESITDVRKAISITDRFLYLKELFANNMEAFNDALDAVNKADTMHEAVNYLARFNWEDNETSQQFLRLVSRRFA